MKSELFSLLYCAFIGDKGSSFLFDSAVASDVWLFFNYYAWLGFQQRCWGRLWGPQRRTLPLERLS